MLLLRDQLEHWMRWLQQNVEYQDEFLHAFVYTGEQDLVFFKDGTNVPRITYICVSKNNNEVFWGLRDGWPELIISRLNYLRSYLVEQDNDASYSTFYFYKYENEKKEITSIAIPIQAVFNTANNYYFADENGQRYRVYKKETRIESTCSAKTKEKNYIPYHFFNTAPLLRYVCAPSGQEQPQLASQNGAIAVSSQCTSISDEAVTMGTDSAESTQGWLEQVFWSDNVN